VRRSFSPLQPVERFDFHFAVARIGCLLLQFWFSVEAGFVLESPDQETQGFWWNVWNTVNYLIHLILNGEASH
jgi:hypothetical protein